MGTNKEGDRLKKIHPQLKKNPISIRLPHWLIHWMDKQPETNRAWLIEEAIKQKHDIKPPKVD